MAIDSDRNPAGNKNNKPTNKETVPREGAVVGKSEKAEKNQNEARNRDQPKSGERIVPPAHDQPPLPTQQEGASKILVYATIALALATMALAYDTHRLANQAVSQTEDNQNALKAAKKSADAATRTATSTRAWLCSNASQSLVGNDVVLNGQHIGQTAAVLVQVVNTGYSPALTVRSSSDYKITEANDVEPVFDDTSKLAVSEKGVIGPGTSIQFGPFLIKPDEVTQISLCQKKLFVHLFLDYADVFQKDVKHETNLTFNLRFAGFDNNNGINVPRWSPVASGFKNSCS